MAEIEDKRRKPFAMVDVEVLRDPQITIQCKALYALLISYGPDRIFPGHERLAHELNCSRKTIVDWMQKLRSADLIDWRRTGRSNRYQILGPTEPSQEEQERCNVDVTSDVRPDNIRCAPQDTSDVTPGLHDLDPSIQTQSSRSREFNTASQQETRQERHGADYLEALLKAKARKASDATSFTLPETAGGADAYKDGPLTQWCALIGRQRANLSSTEETAWARELRRIAEPRGANAETLTWALQQWSRAIVAHNLNDGKRRVWIPGNIAWMSPTPDSLFAHRKDPLRGLSTILAPLLEWGIKHGLGDLDLGQDPQQNMAVEREEPPPRLEI